NSIGEGQYLSTDVATLVSTPGAPSISDVRYLSSRVTIDPSINPASTEFAIRVTQNGSSKYAQPDGSLGPAAAWQTFSAWGGAGGILTNGLKACLAESVDVAARNLDNVATSFGPLSGQTLPCFQLTQNVNGGWNLVSLPVT